MRLPVDTTTARFMAAGPPEPSIDFDTKNPKTDDNGQILFQVPVLCVASGTQELISVRVAGEPKGVAEFTALKIVDLVATTWSMGERSGVSFRAAKIEAAGARAAS
jgi:hypothetical protein